MSTICENVVIELEVEKIDVELSTEQVTMFRGEKGADGQAGRDGLDGKDGTNGKDGADGQNGLDGYSPTATVTQTETGATISIIDKDGTTTAEVFNGQNGADGKDGEDGIDGVDGQDGYTPVKGLDYFTEEEISEIKQEVEESIPMDTYLAELFKDVSYNSTNGHLTFTKHDNSTTYVDLPLELIVTSGYYDGSTKEIVLVLANLQQIRIPVSALMNEYFADETTIQLYVDTADNNKLKFRVKDSVLSAKQNATDNNLETTSKQIVGAINEIRATILSANEQIEDILGV